MSMDAKLKAKWLRALRGGKYKQAQDELKTADGRYCCLGVLCNIAGGKWDLADTLTPSYVPKGAFRKTPGWDSIGPAALTGGIHKRTRDKLAGMNDNGKSFKEIANWIEEHL